MKINSEKTNIVHFRKRSQAKSQYQFRCSGSDLDTVSAYKYLGCVLNEFLDFSVTANVLAGAASRALGAVISKYHQAGGLTHKVFKKMYDVCVIPILDYCAGVWGHKSYEKHDSVQHRAIRSFLGVHRFTSNVVVNGDTGWTPSGARRKMCMVQLWNRILKMPNTRITKRVLLWDFNSEQSHTWSAEIRAVFSEVNMMDTYENLQICDSGKIAEIRSRLMNTFVDKWKDELMSQPKLRTYRLFKHEYGIENYVQMNLTRSSRSFLAQLRSSTLPLHIETGRFVGI